jgi:hypothetical protein
MDTVETEEAVQIVIRLFLNRPASGLKSNK